MTNAGILATADSTILNAIEVVGNVIKARRACT